jgi:hypothetical protein
MRIYFSIYCSFKRNWLSFIVHGFLLNPRSALLIADQPLLSQYGLNFICNFGPQAELQESVDIP